MAVRVREDGSGITRELSLYGECPKCGTPGLHKMPRRLLFTKLDKGVVDRAKERYTYRREVYLNRGYRSYSYGDVWGNERKWIEDLREKYVAAVVAARYHVYALERECYVDECRHAWFELIRRFESDREAEELQFRYPKGLVVQQTG